MCNLAINEKGSSFPVLMRSGSQGAFVVEKGELFISLVNQCLAVSFRAESKDDRHGVLFSSDYDDVVKFFRGWEEVTGKALLDEVGFASAERLTAVEATTRKSELEIVSRVYDLNVAVANPGASRILGAEVPDDTFMEVWIMDDGLHEVVKAYITEDTASEVEDEFYNHIVRR